MADTETSHFSNAINEEEADAILLKETWYILHDLKHVAAMTTVLAAKLEHYQLLILRGFDISS